MSTQITIWHINHLLLRMNSDNVLNAVDHSAKQLPSGILWPSRVITIHHQPTSKITEKAVVFLLFRTFPIIQICLISWNKFCKIQSFSIEPSTSWSSQMHYKLGHIACSVSVCSYRSLASYTDMHRWLFQISSACWIWQRKTLNRKCWVKENHPIFICDKEICQGWQRIPWTLRSFVLHMRK